MDDDPAWLRSISRFFESFRYDVLTASTCAEGLAVAGRHKPACVLLDFHLPDGEADSFCSRIRSDQGLKRTPVIIVSVDGGKECSSYLKCEADGFVLKGGPLGTIRLMVESLLRRVRWERGIIEKGDLRLVTETLMVYMRAKPFARISLEQFRFLYMLVERSPCFVSEDDLLEFVFRAGTTQEKYDALRGLASRLRVKLGRRLGRRIKSKSSSGWIYVQSVKDKRRLVRKD